MGKLGVQKRRKSSPPAYRTPKNRPPGVRTPNSKSLTEALSVCPLQHQYPKLYTVNEGKTRKIKNYQIKLLVSRCCWRDGIKAAMPFP